MPGPARGIGKRPNPDSNWLDCNGLAWALEFAIMKRREMIASAAAAQTTEMKVGAFSVSLAVKNLQVSKAFYAKLGFKVTSGNGKNWQVMRNGDHVIGLFQGMFEKNILTFNPGWDQHTKKLDSFTDVRDLQKQLKAQGVKLESEADEKQERARKFRLDGSRRQPDPV